MGMKMFVNSADSDFKYESTLFPPDFCQNIIGTVSTLNLEKHLYDILLYNFLNSQKCWNPFNTQVNRLTGGQLNESLQYLLVTHT